MHSMFPTVCYFRPANVEYNRHSGAFFFSFLLHYDVHKANGFIELCKCYLLSFLRVSLTLTCWYYKEMCIPEHCRKECYTLFLHLKSSPSNPRFTKIIPDKDTNGSLSTVKFHNLCYINSWLNPIICIRDLS